MSAHSSETKLNDDNPEHIQWLFETVTAQTREFKITGVIYSLTQGVVKNIIPAIASTNAIIASI
jgi:NEDD8-activating enzyme E1